MHMDGLAEHNRPSAVSGAYVSSGRAGSEASNSSPDNLSVLSRIAGIIRQPRSTFAAVAAAPRWAGLLALLVAVSFAVSAAFFSTEVGRQALVDQWERTAIAFGQPVDDARYAEFQELSGRGVPYAAVTALASGPLAAISLAAVLFGVFTAARGGRASFRQVLAVVVHAHVILLLRQLVSTPLNYARESAASPTTLVWLLSGMDEGSAVARLLGLLDLFVLWWLVVLALGLAVLYRLPARRVAALSIGVYVVVALVLVGAMAVFGGVS
jgi:hypothetical protein